MQSFYLIIFSLIFQFLKIYLLWHPPIFTVQMFKQSNLMHLTILITLKITDTIHHSPFKSPSRPLRQPNCFKNQFSQLSPIKFIQEKPANHFKIITEAITSLTISLVPANENDSAVVKRENDWSLNSKDNLQQFHQLALRAVREAKARTKEMRKERK